MHVNVPITLVVIGTFLVLGALYVLLRQVLVTRPGGAVECAAWRPSMTGRSGWQQGMLRFDVDVLRWYRAYSLRPGPELTLRRADLLEMRRTDLGEPPDGTEPVQAVILHRRGGPELQLVAARASVSALVAWWESAPVGAVLGDVD
ncbi:DUF2550 domain-containing protein [Brachybacterium sp. EF45031]|uniref:DUF2550 domain-containing protein n=1 Tax=Brachybacterium sillae TaxID=2810536 RepID=UPI00217DEC3C|nr:DUF2550 domain-containing protein [Brachybacterium sillae]MCS6710910.1 DUF2550 domain-containing protein [Brachybacterium sillae]